MAPPRGPLCQTPGTAALPVRTPSLPSPRASLSGITERVARKKDQRCRGTHGFVLKLSEGALAGADGWGVDSANRAQDAVLGAGPLQEHHVGGEGQPERGMQRIVVKEKLSRSAKRGDSLTPTRNLTRGVGAAALVRLLPRGERLGVSDVLVLEIGEISEDLVAGHAVRDHRQPRPPAGEVPGCKASPPCRRGPR